MQREYPLHFLISKAASSLSYSNTNGIENLTFCKLNVMHTLISIFKRKPYIFSPENNKNAILYSFSNVRNGILYKANQHLDGDLQKKREKRGKKGRTYTRLYMRLLKIRFRQISTCLFKIW